jgi:tetratricopeptide (TPR) repeat protein
MAIRAFLLFMSSSILVLGSIGTAQEVGDKVVVMANYDTKIRDKVVGKVYAGGVHRVVAVDKSTKTAWCHLDNINGWVPLRIVKTLDVADKELSEAIKRNPNAAESLATRGLVRFEMNQAEQALIDFDRARRLEPNSPIILNNMGRVFKAQNQYNQALAAFSEAIRLNPKFTHAYFNRGLVYYSMSDFPKAIKDYDMAIQLDKTDPWFFINRGNAQHAQGDVAAALDSYAAAETLNGKIPEIFVGRSNVYLGQDKLEDAGDGQPSG